MNTISSDLIARWRPSDAQISQGDAFVGVTGSAYTPHLLINKFDGFWTTDVQVVHLPGVFATRNDVSSYLQLAVKDAHASTGLPVVGGWTCHYGNGDWAVFDDIMSVAGQ